MRDQLLRVFNSCWQDTVQEVDKPLSMCCIFVVKVDTIVLCADFEDFVIRTMLQNQLFNQIKGLFMFDVLPHLHNSTPSMRSELLFAIITLHVKFSEFCDEGLFDFSVVVKLLFNRDFNFYSF